MPKTFDELWREINQRGSVITVQEYRELEHVFKLLQGCESYLEVGSAEGNSMYVLAHALKSGAHIAYIDWDEDHTRAPRQEVVKAITDMGITVMPVHSDSNDFAAKEQIKDYRYDAVLIDAGHEDFNVAVDAMLYAPLATKYIIFHDLMIKDVSRVFDWYCKQRQDCRNYTFIRSENYGYGIMEIGA